MNQLITKERVRALYVLKSEHARGCPHCAPQKAKLSMVFGEGNPDAKIMFIGEDPGEEEDKLGRPFVGRAGKLLDKQIEAMGLAREEVYIANIVKCRPPDNRVPTPEEVRLCMPYLIGQIEIIKPMALVTLGATASKYLLDNPILAITRERGTWKMFRDIPLMPTYHPAYLLRSYTLENRKKVWDDLKKVLEKVGLRVPRSRSDFSGLVPK